MIATCVDVYVKNNSIESFIAATELNHKASIQEPENIRFDILQDPNDSSHFLLYEAYRSPEGAAHHKESPHYLQWREAVADWMAQPRKGTPYTILFPQQN